MAVDSEVRLDTYTNVAFDKLLEPQFFFHLQNKIDGVVK